MDAPKLRHHRTLVFRQFFALLALHSSVTHRAQSAPLTSAMIGSPKAVLSNQSIQNRLRRSVVQRPMVRILLWRS